MADEELPPARSLTTFDNVRFALVRTTKPGNIGTAARALANFGFADLALVDPQCDPTDAEAARLSARAEPFLRAAVSFATLSDAVADRQLVLATTARRGGVVRDGAFQDWAEAVGAAASLAARCKVAIVFGPERTGLQNEDLRHCHRLTSIPTAERYPTLNLAQAVTVVAYELGSRLSRREDATAAGDEHEVAAFSDIERSLTALRNAFETVGFLRHDKSGRLFDGFARTILRASPRPNEVDILTGLARQIEWFAGHRVSRHEP